MRWSLAILAAWAALASASLVQDNLPASFWYEPGELVVHDAKTAECPRIEFDRSIKRAFHGEWLVTLQRQTPVGFTVYGVFQGTNDYRPDSVLPEEMDFAWWAWIEPEDCRFPSGVYRILTQWTIQPGGAERFARVTSNIFTVSP